MKSPDFSAFIPGITPTERKPNRLKIVDTRKEDQPTSQQTVQEAGNPGAPVFWHYDQYPLPMPSHHRYPRGRFSMVRAALVSEGIIAEAALRAATPVEWSQLERVHAPGYLQAVREGTLSEKAIREIGLPFSPELVLRARAAVKATLQAATSLLEAGDGKIANWKGAGVIGGGTHHAFADRGTGYCLFSDIAVTIRELQAQHLQAWQQGSDNGGGNETGGDNGGRNESGTAARGPKRYFIVDLDVHQGNGNAEIFEGDESVFTFSAHGEKNWPHRKSRSDMDLGLPDGLRDEAYLEAVFPPLNAAMAAFKPDMVFYQAGVDPLANDRLGRLNLSLSGLRERDRRVFELCRGLGAPVVLTMGGGYGRPLEDSVRAHLNTVRELHAAMM